MRDCQEIIKQIKAVVPAESTQFHEDLNWVFNDAFYKAPEETLQWMRLTECVTRHIAEPNRDSQEWEFQVWSILSTVPVEQIKKEIRG